MSVDRKRRAERRLSQIHRRWTDGILNVDILKTVSEYDQSNLRRVATAQAEAAHRRAESEGIIRSTRPVHPDQELSLFRVMAESTLTSYYASVRAARLVFWHSVLDGIAADLCSLTASFNPFSWDKVVEAKTVKLVDVRRSSYEDIRSKVIKKIIASEIERASLKVKVTILYQVCSVTDDWSGLTNYTFSMDELERIDGLRHELVHGNGLGAAARNITETDIDYFRTTALHLILVVAYAFDLQMSIYDMFPETTGGNQTTDAGSG